MGLRWVHKHCPNINFLIKVDDDVILNIFQVLQHLFPRFNMWQYRRTIGCSLNSIGSPIFRGEEDKWRVHEDEFAGLERYPFSYCNGFFIIMTGDLVGPLLKAAKVVPHFWIDDVYLTGMLPLVIHDLQKMNFGAYTATFTDARRCFQQFGRRCIYSAINNRDSEFDKMDVLLFWRQITSTRY